jgi:CDP-diacylglycerol---glycerol-3-phosphate 3-phosphatidyltransferase
MNVVRCERDLQRRAAFITLKRDGYKERRMSISTEKPQGPLGLATGEELRTVVFNLPNQLTWLRLALTVVMFCLIAWGQYSISLALFLVAASTDWLDGYFARKYNLVTTLGRILDPFADKVIICGTFIYLAAIAGSGVRPWMAVVIVGRELLVTALRSFLEQQGADFSATLSGKLKMVLQCVAAGLSLFVLAWPELATRGGEPLSILLVGSMWAAVLLTVLSGVAYVRSAIQLLRRA